MKSNTLYIITNSYPEEKHAFSSDEFEYVLNHYSNVKILSFSKYRPREISSKIEYISILQGILEILFPKKIKRKNMVSNIYGIISLNDIRESLMNLYSFICAMSIIRVNNLQDEDLLFSYWLSRSSRIAYYVHNLINTRYICQGHGSDIYKYPPKNLDKILKAAEYIVTVGNNNKRFISNTYHISENKTRIFRLGIGSEMAKKISERTKVIESDTGIRFITVARFEEVKGVDILLESIKLLKESNMLSESIHFDIFGDGRKFQEYFSYIEKYNLSDYVTLRGWIDRDGLVDELAKATAYILPSRSEGLPVVLMESCAAGLPIIATDVGSTTDIAIEGKNAIVCSLPNSELLSEAIVRFINLKPADISIMKDFSFDIFGADYRLEKNLSEKYSFIYDIANGTY
ncbi:glycosyltransferase family 4 protein [Youngiibacter multivorans]|uniref:Glycosyltransferase involved in cell wall biosynthesis n=1 Tax=Youngiibacter multivorans TaxID=937251 RepID=A0ABS4G389_9CLOT|nr:glycosyltransferase family 4 protein [Youngiibacter multivorans]MBP1919013.1 glycosyltransferase involved in cell wall biosynthesis [Youngiibacter multivorans]